MRKITKEIVAAFLNHECKRIGNSKTGGEFLYLNDRPWDGSWTEVR